MLNGPSFSINNLLAGLLNMQNSFQPTQTTQIYQSEPLQCGECSMTYQQFIQIGRFGCAHCYETFSGQIQPILKRLHSGNWTHNGKIPSRIGGSIQIQKNIENLKKKIAELISLEEFEQAAEIRDQIRSLEKELNRAKEGGE